jgi:predicted transcriptional regulator
MLLCPATSPAQDMWEGGWMKTVTLDVQPLAGSLTDFARAWKTGKRDTAARINFATPDLLWNVLTTKRWDLLKAMAGQGSMSLREAARRVHRDVKGGHGDAHALLDAGVLRRTDDGRIKFPYDAVPREGHWREQATSRNGRSQSVPTIYATRSATATIIIITIRFHAWRKIEQLTVPASSGTQCPRHRLAATQCHDGPCG